MPRNHVKAKLIEITCAHCRITFFTRSWKASRIYCSTSCASSAPRPRRRLPITERFWSKVDKTPGFGPEGTCWIWQGGKSGDGYGLMRITENGRRLIRGAHQVSIELFSGQPLNGLWALHHCDNPPCVNPDHLFRGTRKDNALDMVRKGRAGNRYKKEVA